MQPGSSVVTALLQLITTSDDDAFAGELPKLLLVSPLCCSRLQLITTSDDDALAGGLPKALCVSPVCCLKSLLAAHHDNDAAFAVRSNFHNVLCDVRCHSICSTKCGHIHGLV